MSDYDADSDVDLLAIRGGTLERDCRLKGLSSGLCSHRSSSQSLCFIFCQKRDGFLVYAVKR